MLYKLFINIIAMIITCHVLISCVDNENNIYGQWATDKNSITLDFMSDHSGTQKVSSDFMSYADKLNVQVGREFNFRWKLLKDNRIKIEYSNGSVVTLTIDGNKLTQDVLESPLYYYKK
jgi:hypothetical protein